MKKLIALTGLTLIVALTGCNTFKGVGKDISKGGEAVTNSAEKTQQKM